MLLAEMEKRAETSHHSPRSVRTKREPSPSAKERKTKAPKSVKLQEPHKRKEKPEVTEEEESGEAKEAQIISSSTVVNVDSVRERIKEDREELLGLLETEGPGEGKFGQENLKKDGEPGFFCHSSFIFLKRLEEEIPWSL